MKTVADKISDYESERVNDLLDAVPITNEELSLSEFQGSSSTSSRLIIRGCDCLSVDIEQTCWV